MRRTVTMIVAVAALFATGMAAGLALGPRALEPPPRIAFLANGRVPADALAAGPVAGQLGAPLFTTEASLLSTAARDGIDGYDPDLVIVLGGPVAVSDAVVQALADALGLPVLAPDQVDDGRDGVVRVAGDDRFLTAAAVADLIRAFHPAFVPADTTAFALSDTACTQGRVMDGVRADGTPRCADVDATTIDGQPTSSLRTAQLESTQGENLDGNVTTTESMLFRIPGNHTPGDDLTFQVLAPRPTTCDYYVFTAFASHLRADVLNDPIADRVVSEPGVVSPASGTAAWIHLTWVVDGDNGEPFRPGDEVSIAMRRDPSDPRDTCTNDLFLRSTQVRY